MEKYLIAGNASQVSDGAGAVLLMKRRVALEKNLPILGVFRFVFSPQKSSNSYGHNHIVIVYRIGKDVAVCMHGLLISGLSIFRISS